MATIRLPPDFNGFLKLLNSREVRYLVVGGYAVNYHGVPRATGDIDIWIDNSPTNAAKVAAVVREFGFSQATPEVFSEAGKVVRMGVPPLRIEILTSVSGVDFGRCFANRTTADFGGATAHMIGLDDLKANKKAAGRLKDRADLEQLG